MNFLDSVTTHYQRALAAAPPAERNFRERAWSAFARLGLPDRQSETWRYSPLTAITRQAWPVAATDATVPEAAKAWRERLRGVFDVAVVVNGVLDKEASVLSEELRGCLGPSRWSEAFLPEDGFSGLAAAMSSSGLRLALPAGLRPRRPLALLYSHTGHGQWSAACNELELGAGSALQMAEIYVGGDSRYLRSQVSRARLGEKAELHVLSLQMEATEAFHFSDCSYSLETGARLSLQPLHTGAAWARATTRVDLVGSEGEAHIHGLTFAGGRQHVDQRIVVNHRAPLTRSRQLFKGVLKDQARGILNGKIMIAPDAQKVISSQLNHNLLLSPGAEADTKPELEIYADDVKANHGASIGRLDEAKIFYLVSRGIPRSEAQRLLAQAFVTDVLMKIEAGPLRALAETATRDRLGEFMEGMQT